MAPTLGETWLCAQECSDGPARPGCRLSQVGVVTRVCQTMRDLHLVPPPAAWFPPGDPTTEAEPSGHTHSRTTSPLLYGKSAVSCSWNWPREPHRCVGKGFGAWLSASPVAQPRAQLTDPRVKEMPGIRNTVKNTGEMLRLFKVLGFFLLFST